MSLLPEQARKTSTGGSSPQEHFLQCMLDPMLSYHAWCTLCMHSVQPPSRTELLMQLVNK